MCDVHSADQYLNSFYAIISNYNALQDASQPEPVRFLLAENERKNQEARRAVRLEEHEKEKAKRRLTNGSLALI